MRPDSTLDDSKLEQVVKEYPNGATQSVAHYQTPEGICQDPPTGEPAILMFNRDGSIAVAEHYQYGELHDPIDGRPAVTHWFQGSTVVSHEMHYQAGVLCDPPDGTPAVREYDSDGHPFHEAHYRGGLLDDPVDGSPAMVWLDPDGNVTKALHFLRGKEISDA